MGEVTKSNLATAINVHKHLQSMCINTPTYSHMQNKRNKLEQVVVTSDVLFLMSILTM